MTEAEYQIARLSDARLAVHALGAAPVWLWRHDAKQILWANPVAAAIFEAGSPAAVTKIDFDSAHPAATQIRRLASTLPQGDMPRLERLRGFGASLGGTLVCLCSRFPLGEGESAVLVVATERAGLTLSLPERARRLLADFPQPAILFAADGDPVRENSAARERFGATISLARIGAENLAREAARSDRAEGVTAMGPARVLKLGAGASFLLLVLFEPDTPSHATAPSIPALARPPVPEPVGGTASAAAPARIPTEHAAKGGTADAGTVKPAIPAGPMLPDAAAPEAQIHPLPVRFVWQMDAGHRFTRGIEDFTRLLGPKTAAVLLSEPWERAAAALQLDPKGEVARAIAAQQTFSGIVLDWPVDGTGERLAIELSGLPVFDRDRRFAGFRGFALCRDPTKRARGVSEASPDRIADRSASSLREDAARADAAARANGRPPDHPPVALSPGEQSAFQELARELGARLGRPVRQAGGPPMPATASEPARHTDAMRTLLDRLPIGILIYRLDTLLFANRTFLDWTGHRDLAALVEAGGLDSLLIEMKDAPSLDPDRAPTTLTVATASGRERPIEGRLHGISWDGDRALMLVLSPPAPRGDEELTRLKAESRELATILDTATDGILVLDRRSRVISANRSAQALFGIDASDFTRLSFADLFVPESRPGLLDDLSRIARGSGIGALGAGREALTRLPRGGVVPVNVTLGRIEDGEKLCAILRDVTAWKRSEEELVNARREAEKASLAKSEFVAWISRELRTPLNAIIGFAEIMAEERFGPLGNERYRQYLKDIRASGIHLISLVDDLLDLSKIETGKLDLSFVSVDLNDLVQQCVAMLQQDANRERVILRTSLASDLPAVIADARSIRQITLNLLSHSIKFAGAGGQVIVSTALGDTGEAFLRVRDTGRGMSDGELQRVLEPLAQSDRSEPGAGSGTGLDLPITKALVEANRARFRITSRPDSGTLVEIAFPAARGATR
jgi:PAS domain S-box-containing protein